MSRLKELENTMLSILLEYPEAREMAETAYYRYTQKMGQHWDLTLWELDALVKNGKLSSFESVSRCCRKIKEKHPELMSEKQKEKRLVKVSEFLDYVKDEEYESWLDELVESLELEEEDK